MWKQTPKMPAYLREPEEVRAEKASDNEEKEKKEEQVFFSQSEMELEEEEEQRHKIMAGFTIEIQNSTSHIKEFMEREENEEAEKTITEKEPESDSDEGLCDFKVLNLEDMNYINEVDNSR